MTGSRPLPDWLTRLAGGLADPDATGRIVATRPGRNGRSAAVLVAISGDADGHDRRVLLIERAHTLRHHPGQLAFPGGAVDPGDRDSAHTALREGTEEVGLDPTGVQVLGALPASHVAVSGFDVTAVVGWWHTPGTVGVSDPAEVAQVMVVELDHLLDPANRVRVRHPRGYIGPAFWLPVGDPADDADADVEPLLLWGLSAHLLDGIIELAGWSRPWDRDRKVEIPPRFLSDFGRGRPDDH